MKRILVILGLLLSIPATGIGAQQVTMKVEVGFDQNHKSDSWTPIAAEMENLGGDVDGRIVVETTEMHGGGSVVNRYTTAFDLPSGGKKRFVLYARLRGVQQTLHVEAVSGRRVVASQDVTVRPSYQEDRVLLAISGDGMGGGLSLPAGIKVPSRSANANQYNPSISSQNQGELKVWNTKVSNLPDHWKGYDGVDVIALGSVAASALPTERQRAIRSWVQAGGTLVIAGGVDWRRLRDPFYRELLPVEVTGSTQLSSLGSLASFGGEPIAMAGPVLVPSATPIPGAKVVLAEGGAPVIVERGVGLGKVVYLAPDYSLPPLSGWSGQTGLWKHYLLDLPMDATLLGEIRRDDSQGQNLNNYNPGQGNSLVSAVTNIPAMDVPSFVFIGIFLAAYIVVLVPVNYFVLRKKDKREYAWITIPIIVVVFSLGAYIIGYAIKGGQVLVDQASLIETATGSSQAAALDYAGIFSPGKTAYDISFADRQAISSEADQAQQKSDVTIETGDGISVRDLAIDMWSMRVLKSESVVDLGGEFAAKLSTASGSLEGKISNNTDYALQNCAIYYDGSCEQIGDLPSGAQDVGISTKGAPGSVAPTMLAFAAGSSQEKIARAMWDRVFNNSTGAQASSVSSDPILCGWITKAAIAPDLHRRFVKREAVGMVLVHLKVGQGGTVSRAPAGTSDFKILDNQASWNGPSEGQGAVSGTMQPGSITVRFMLPSGSRGKTPRELRVRKSTAGSVKVEIQDKQGQWFQLPPRDMVAVPDPARYVRQDTGEVTLRITNQQGYQIDLGTLDIAFTGR